jgi:long-chain-fatty-acid--CoA ligase ACSBG
LPVGVYTTNNSEACYYIAENSECSVVVVENNEQLEKYMLIKDKLPLLKKIIIINDIPNQHWKSNPYLITSWNDFIKPL